MYNRREKYASLTIIISLIVIFFAAMPSPTNIFTINEIRKPSFEFGGNRQIKWPSDTIPTIITNRRSEFLGNKSASEIIRIRTDNSVFETNMSINNIKLNEIDYPLETYVHNSQTSNALLQYTYFQQISVPSSCYLPWISLFTQFLNPNTAALNWELSIFNATAEDDVNPLAVPSAEIPSTITYFNPADENYSIFNINYNRPHWENISMPVVVLNKSNTYFYDGLYHFFVAIKMPTLNSGNHHWFYNNDTETGGLDNGRAFSSVLGFRTELTGIDFTLRTKIVPVSSTPDPSSIDMRVNGEPVIDIGPNIGQYYSIESRFSRNGYVAYQISSEWSNHPEGDMQYDLNLTYLKGDNLYPEITLEIEEGSTNVEWEVQFNVSFIQDPNFEYATIFSDLPITWNINSLENTTLGNNSSVNYDITLSPTTKHQILTIPDLTPGNYNLTCTSDLAQGNINLNLIDGAIELDSFLNGNVTATSGTNGDLTWLRSDYEGSLDAIIPISGEVNDTLESRAQFHDNRSIRFSNTLLIDLFTLLLSLGNDLATNVYQLDLESVFELSLDELDGLDENNIDNIGISIHDDLFRESLAIANISSIDVPDNPAWNVAAIPANEYFLRCLLFDNYTIDMNIPYNDSEARLSDIYMNFTARVIENATEINRGRISEITLDTYMDYNKSIATQSIFVKNQTNGNFIELNNSIMKDDAGDQIHLYWNSSNDAEIQNITQLINPINNTVEIFLQTVNSSYIDAEKTKKLDTALMTFKYSNTFSNFSIKFYNWTANNFTENYTLFGRNMSEPDANFQYSGDQDAMLDIFNESSNSVRVSIKASAIIPIYNMIYWDLDRIMLNVSYFGYTRYDWNETVYNGDEIHRFKNSTQTLYESPTDNYTVSIDVNDIIDFYDNYIYEVTWSNGTDIGIFQLPFAINRKNVIVDVNIENDVSWMQGNTFKTYDIKINYDLNGSALENKTIIAEVTAIFRNGLPATYSYSAVTDNEGKVVFNLDIPAEWRSFTMTFAFQSDNPRIKSIETAPSDSIEVLNEVEFIGRVLLNNWLLLAIIATLIISIFAVKKQNDAKKRRKWAEDASIIHDVIKIKHLLAIMKQSGTCVVERSYSKEKLEADLVSGFLTAIASFGKEVGNKNKKESVGEAIIFDYQDFKILMMDGRYSRVALILDGVPTESLKDRLQSFINLFESSYPLENWKGNVSIFKDIDNLIESAFKITLIYPLVISKEADPANIKSNLQKALFEVAEAVQQEKQAFYLSTLVAFAQAGRKESQSHVLSAIYQLKQANIFTFYTP